jgi:hypothetical protein
VVQSDNATEPHCHSPLLFDYPIGILRTNEDGGGRMTGGPRLRPAWKSWDAGMKTKERMQKKNTICMPSKGYL